MVNAVYGLVADVCNLQVEIVYQCHVTTDYRLLCCVTSELCEM